MGTFSRKDKEKKTCLLIKGDVEIPSDLHGIGYYRFRDSVRECFLDIDNELKKAELIK